MLNIFATITTLGLQTGSARTISYYIGKGEKSLTKSVVDWSVLIVTVLGSGIAILIFSSSGFISSEIFNDTDLSLPLKVFSIAIPFLALINVLVSAFRGFESARERVIFDNILKNLLFLIMLIFILTIGLAFITTVFAYTVSMVLTSIFFLFYFLKKRYNLFSEKQINLSKRIGKILLLFSLPLFFMQILNQLMGWVDTLMVGSLLTSKDIGLYNAAFPLARHLTLVVSSMTFIFMPLMTKFYAQGNLNEMKTFYIIFVKWATSLTIPFFLLIFLFPGTVLDFLFGADYVSAGTTLQILSLGFLLTVLLGPNGGTLIAIGETRFMMWVSLIAIIVDILLNAWLIPIIGILGAAIATSSTVFSIGVIRVLKLYYSYGIQPVTRKILKPIFLSILLIAVIYFIIEELLLVKFWMLPFIGIAFLILYGLSLFLTKGFDKEDDAILQLIEGLTGYNLDFVRKIINRFN